MSKHTKEPWEKNTTVYGYVSDSHVIIKTEDYDRARKCVNALAGIDDPESHLFKLRRAVELLRDLAELQNGAPLHSQREEWEWVMRETYKLLEEIE